MCGRPIWPQSLLSPRRTTIALTNDAKVMMLAHISTMIPVMDVWRELPGMGRSRSRSSPPPPPGGSSGAIGGGPPRFDWVMVWAMEPVSLLSLLEDLKQVAVVVCPHTTGCRLRFGSPSVDKNPIGGQYPLIGLRWVVHGLRLLLEGRCERIDHWFQIQIAIGQMNRQNAVGFQNAKVEGKGLPRH